MLMREKVVNSSINKEKRIMITILARERVKFLKATLRLFHR